MEVKNIDASMPKKWLDNNEAVLIDVREPAEHKALHISGAALTPLSLICCNNLPDSDKKVVLHCQKGARGTNACQKLLAENSTIELYNLEGGIEAAHAAFSSHAPDKDHAPQIAFFSWNGKAEPLSSVLHQYVTRPHGNACGLPSHGIR